MPKKAQGMRPQVSDDEDLVGPPSRSSRPSVPSEPTAPSPRRSKRQRIIDSNPGASASSPGSSSRSSARSSGVRRHNKKGMVPLPGGQQDNLLSPSIIPGAEEQSRSPSRTSVSASSDMQVTIEPNHPRFFCGANNFVMNHPIMADNIQFRGNFDSVLERFKEHITLGAEFDSSDRDPPPRCHPGTRVAILAEAQGQLRDIEQGKRLMWLYGPPGVGKSAIMQTLAEMEAKSGHLGATFFFSRPNKRNNPKRMFPTIAYGLATKNPLYKAYLQGQMDSNPMFLQKGLDEQFKILITEPFTQRTIGGGGGMRTIVIDGLDECEDPEAQCSIVHLLSNFAVNSPSVPLAWVIASRPEAHLKTVFSRSYILPSCWHKEVPVDSNDSIQDVERFLNDSFRDIRENFPNHFAIGERWPTEEQFLQILTAAGGLFVFAATVVRFAKDIDFDDPVSQLERVLAVIEKAGPSGEEHPLRLLHEMYTEILSLVPRNVFPNMKKILAYILLSRPGSFRLLCNILGLKQNEAYSAIRRLHSVLDIPAVEFANTKEITFFHASFSEYLRDPTLSGAFAVDLGEASKYVWDRCFEIVQQADAPVCGLSDRAYDIPLSWGYQNCRLDSRLKTEVCIEARLRWLHLLLPDCACSVPSLKDLPPLQLTTHERIQALKKIDFSKLCHIYGDVSEETPFHHFSLCSWLLKIWEESPEELQAAGYVQRMTIGELDLERINTAKPRMVLHVDCYQSSGNPGLYSQYGDTTEGFILDLTLDKLEERMEQDPSKMALMVGNEPSKCCVMFQVEHEGEGVYDPEHHRQINKELFFLPYC